MLSLSITQFRFSYASSKANSSILSSTGTFSPVAVETRLSAMAVSIAFGGVIAALLMIFVTGVRPRLIRFASYIKMAEMTGSAMVSEHLPRQEISWIVRTLFIQSASFLID